MPPKPGDVHVGEEAPHFCLHDKDNKETCLGDFKGKWVVLYFYPRDNTSGCNREAVEFTSALDEFEKLNAVVLGVSADSAASHQKFAEKHSLKVMLLSDEAPNSGTPVGTAFGRSIITHDRKDEAWNSHRRTAITKQNVCIRRSHSCWYATGRKAY